MLFESPAGQGELRFTQLLNADTLSFTLSTHYKIIHFEPISPLKTTKGLQSDLFSHINFTTNTICIQYLI